MVTVPEYAGPLDLLLALTQKRRLDVTAVSLAAVADQYLEQVLVMKEELDALSEFLVLASQLLLIKSRALLPDIPGAEPETDPAEDLRRRLSEYLILRSAAGWLGEREATGWRSWGRGGELPASDAPSVLAPITGTSLGRYWVPRVSRIPDEGPASTLASFTRPTLRARATYLLDRVTARDWFPLGPLLGLDPPTAVATFVAVLTLVRAGLLFVRQQESATLPEVRSAEGASVGLLPGIAWS
jgi:segregation and condensation protein A